MNHYSKAIALSQEPQPLENGMLPGFEAIPEDTQKKMRPDFTSEVRFYLRIQSLKGEWFFLWKTHTNGGCEWVNESKAGSKRPLRYKTVSGAMRQLEQYTRSMVLESKKVEVWNGGKS